MQMVYIAGAKESENQIENGEYLTDDQVNKLIKKWLDE